MPVDFLDIEDSLIEELVIVQEKVIEFPGKTNTKFDWFREKPAKKRMVVYFGRNSAPPDYDLLFVGVRGKTNWKQNADLGTGLLLYCEAAGFKPEGSYLMRPNLIVLSVDHKSRSARFGPIGGIKVEDDLQGLGLGGYLMAQTIQWSMQLYPHYRVATGSLGYAPTETYLKRRTNFYKNAGFSFEPEGVAPEKATGFYKERIDMLNGTWNTKVEEIPASQILNEREEAIQAQQEAETELLTARAAYEINLKKKRGFKLSTYVLGCFILLLVIFPGLDRFLHSAMFELSKSLLRAVLHR
jgi:GNAT superfamily N-acetyltransferase